MSAPAASRYLFWHRGTVQGDLFGALGSFNETRLVTREFANELFEDIFATADPAEWYFQNSGNGPFLPEYRYNTRYELLFMTNTHVVRTPVISIVP